MKGKIKSKIICFLMILFMITITTTNIIAADEFKMIIDTESFIVSDREVTVGDTVTIQMKITGNTTNPLKLVRVCWIKPVTKQNKSFDMTYNSITGLYELELNIDDTWQNGTYYIDYIYRI